MVPTTMEFNLMVPIKKNKVFGKIKLIHDIRE